MIEHNWRQILVGAGLVWPAIRCAISIVPPELMYSVTPVIAKHKVSMSAISQNSHFKQSKTAPWD
jgi:hypothetical protein